MPNYPPTAPILISIFSRSIALAVLSLWMGVPYLSADESPAYLKTISDRADKIVATLGLELAEKRVRADDLIVSQYRWLHETHNQRDMDLRSIRDESLEPGQLEQRTLDIRETFDQKIKQRHAEFLAMLAELLTPSQIDGVKDGMTYGVVRVTTDAYLKMLPDLTEEQKKYIQEQLIEARELAMDAGASEEKHKLFGKYKGRINNYLSQAGYDLKAASKRLESQSPN